MDKFLNIGFAKISTILAVILSIIYVLRFINNKYFSNKNLFLKFIDKVLRKRHKLLGIILIITGLIHGIYSSESVFSFSLGTICWVLSIVLGFNYMMRKRFKKKSWIYYHRILTVIFLVVLASHILQVKLNSPADRIREKERVDNSIIQQYENDSNFSSNKDLSKTKYKDGIYTGTGRGFRPELKVQVTIKNNKITDINIIEHNESKGYYEEPFQIVPKEIIEKQSTDVDAVSGATRSSNGIKEAVDDALSKAME